MNVDQPNHTLKKLLLSFAIIPLAAFAQTVPLTQDAYVVAGNGSNFGGTVSMNVNGVNNSQSLAQFDLSPSPASLPPTFPEPL